MVSAACEDGGVSGSSPGRAGLRMRDMIGAVVVLLVVTGVLVTTTRGCSFDPGGPDVSRETAPSVDVSAKLTDAAGTVTFPVRHPAVPDDWHANSSSTAAVGAGAAADVVVRVGWITPESRYVQLSQSGGAPADVLAAETGGTAKPTDEVTAGGLEWAVHPARRDEVAWLHTTDDVVLLITGSGTEDDFRTLAEATATAEQLG